MGFLDIYTGTIKVDLGNDFHVNIKKFLSNADYTIAQGALMRDQQVDSDGIKAQIDTTAYVHVLVRRAIVDWNLTDEKDVAMEVTDANISKLPQVAFNKIYKAIEAANEERSPEEQGVFLATN